ncbi:MAG: choline ABC transporter substrate-binding protein [Gammaproteobacteria bacterium]|nr:choline ABC transporter substrate-binding protein [Gammaproteobacteria bacterium]
MSSLRRVITIVGLVACVFSITAVSAAEPAECRRVNFADVDWTDIQATTALTSVVLEGLGYKPKRVTVAVPKVFDGIKRKTINVFLGYWNPSMTPIAEPYLKDGSVMMVPKPNLTGAKYTLAVPTYVADAGLHSFADINKFRTQLAAEIYGLEPGNDGNLLIKKMIDGDSFNLKGFKLVESSEEFMLTYVERAVKQKKPVVFLGWAPHPMNERFQMTYLSGGDDVFGPNFGGAEVFTVVAPDYIEKCPNVGTFIKNLQFTLSMESQVMGPILEKRDPAEAATEWLKKHPSTLLGWLKGVKTFDGRDGLTAVRSHLGL